MLTLSAGEGEPGQLTKNRRYETTYDALNDQRIRQATAHLAPCTLPQQAYGPQPIEWQRTRPPEIWAWITCVMRPLRRSLP